MMGLHAVPLTLDQANAAVASWHRHHDPDQGHRFSIGAVDDDGHLVGVCIVGRPRGPKTEQYNIAEVTRLATNGHRNACSFLYGAAARAAKAIGFLSIQTFTLPSEGGASLRAAGWTNEGENDSGGVREGWATRPGRKNKNTGTKWRWRRVLNERPPPVYLKPTHEQSSQLDLI